jgi:hypothetical protein
MKILKDIDERMSKLRDYVNQDELNILQFMKTEIEAVLNNQKRARKFLKNVPIGKYDNDRRKYNF